MTDGPASHTLSRPRHAILDILPQLVALALRKLANQVRDEIPLVVCRERDDAAHWWDVEGACDAIERLDGERREAVLDARQVVCRERASLGEVLQRHTALGPQFADAGADPMVALEGIVRIRAIPVRGSVTGAAARRLNRRYRRSGGD